jgi:hypothetical protein
VINIAIPVVIYFVGLVFAAGGGWFALKEVRKQVNGVGAKCRASDEQRKDEHRRVCMAIVAIASEAQQKIVVPCLSGDPQ